MSGILGGLIGSFSRSLNSYESIATTVVGVGGSTSVTFSGISQVYKHLQLRVTNRDTGVLNQMNYAYLQFNGDTATNYAWQVVYGDGASALAVATGVSSTNLRAFNTLGGGAPANVFAPSITDIYDYTSTVKNKVIRSNAGYDANGTGQSHIWGGVWFNATIAAITSITISSFGTWAQNSTFALYGIKG